MANQILKKTKEIQSIGSILDCLAYHCSKLDEPQSLAAITLFSCMIATGRDYMKTKSAQLLLELSFNAKRQKPPSENVASLAVARGLKKQFQLHR
jgi:hypothetical protein